MIFTRYTSLSPSTQECHDPATSKHASDREFMGKQLRNALVNQRSPQGDEGAYFNKTRVDQDARAERIKSATDDGCSRAARIIGGSNTQTGRNANGCC